MKTFLVATLLLCAVFIAPAAHAAEPRKTEVLQRVDVESKGHNMNLILPLGVVAAGMGLAWAASRLKVAGGD